MKLRSQQQRGAYDAISSAEQFASALTTDLRSVSHDGHLEVVFSEHAIPLRTAGNVPSAEEQAEEVAQIKRLNFGFESVGRLPFNIGYLDLRAFAPPQLVEKKIAAAMTLLGDTRALIIDLRKNDGGDPQTVALVASYLLDKRTHLNDIYSREDDRTHQMWSRGSLSGPRYGAQRKVYLLTSHDTFSAGEDFSYAMKNLRRAMLIGETTGGGAHPGEGHRLDSHFGVFIPSGRSISPITHTDWESTGVTPDIAVPAEKALNVAQQKLLAGFLAVERDAERRDQLQKRIHELD